MKKIIIFFTILILLISFIFGSLIQIIFNKPNKVKSENKIHLPKITLTDLNNNKIKFNKINQPTIILFWLPQSETCQQQLEILTEINQKYQNKLQVLAVGIGNLNQKKIIKLAEEKKVNYPIVIDYKTKLTEKLKISTIPTILIYTPSSRPDLISGLQETKDLENIIKDKILNQSLKN